MTVIHPNSISGITSVTSHSNALNFYESDHSTKLTINAHVAGNVTGNVTGDITATNGTFSGDVTVGGTLTYEDVTNIDSVGVVTARNGLHVTGGSIGIGTVSPSGPVHAHTASGTQRSYLEASASHSFLRLKSGSTSYNSGVEFFSGASNIANVTGLGAGGLQFEVGGSERLRIDSDGRLLAGGATASNAWAGGDDLILGNTNSGTRTGITLVSHSGSDGGIYWSDGTSSNNDYLQGQVVYNHANGVMSFYTAAAARLRINPDGKVLVKAATVSSNRADAPLQVETGANGNALNLRARSGDNIYSYLNFQNNAGSQTAAHIYLERDASNNAGTLVFGTASASANTPTERFKIHSSGATSMHVNSASHDTFRFTTQGVNEAKLIMKDASNNDDVVLNTGGNSWVNGGYFGIGTNGPGAPLHILSTAYPTALIQRNHGTNYPRLRITNTSNHGADIDGIGDGSPAGGLRVSTVTAATSTERVRIYGDGTTRIRGVNRNSPFTVSNTTGTVFILDDTQPSAVGTGGKIVFGSKYYTASNTMGTAFIGSYKDNAPSNGSNEYEHSLIFGTNSSNHGFSERMRITHDGRVHIGDSLGNNHSGMFQVIHEGGGNQTNDCLAFFETNANDWCIITNSNEGGNASHYHMYFMEEGSVRGQIAGSHGSNVNFTQGSDYRWKENIIDLTGTEGIDICKRLRPRKYNWIKNREGTGQINTVDGFIAHEVQEAGVLGAVIGEKDAVKEDGSIDGQMLDYGQMTPVLAAAIKGLIAKVETLEAQVTALQGS